MPYAPGITDISGQLLAQGMQQRAEGIAGGLTSWLKGYDQNQALKRQAMSTFAGAMSADPEILKYLTAAQEGQQQGLANAPKVPPEVLKAFANSQKGDVDLYDASILANFAGTYQKTKGEAQQRALQAAQAARLTEETAAAQGQRMLQEQAFNRMRNMASGAGAGVYSPDVQAQMAANPFVQAQMQAMQAGAPMTGGQLGQFVMGQQEMAAKQMGAGGAQTEFERKVQRLRDAFVAKEGRSPTAQEEVELMQKGARLGSAAFRPGQAIADKNGNYLGNAVFNEETGRWNVVNLQGEPLPVPEGARPATATAMTRDIVNYNEFKKIRGDLTQDEIALNNLTKYLETQKDTQTGLSRLSDKISANVKTLFNTGQLNKAEFAQAYASGQLQGLLGANRLSVVGGGVLTEQDALRVIDRLGGNVDALQNPELVQQAVADLYANKVKTYKDNLRFHNAAVDSFWSNHGFERAEPVKLDEGLLQLSQQPVYRGGLNEEQRRRKAELEAKKAGK